jgi:probable rRNA maturation factor
MNVTVDLQNASGSRAVPLRRQFRSWANAALRHVATDMPRASLSIRLVDEIESAALNARYRGKPGATNVLSFPVPAGMPAQLLGDLAICASVVAREAAEQAKDAEAHWAHLTVHGVLHLRGYDHEKPGEARAMEALETKILAQLGYADPYQ